MGTLATILLLALTRAEIVERFKAPPITMVEGLVKVFADCPADMRRDFQMPIAEFTAGVCRDLYKTVNVRPRRFVEPGVIVHIGEERTNNASVVSLARTREDGSVYTRIYLPSPGSTDIARMRLETTKAFFRAVTGEELDDAAAEKALRRADPRLDADDRYADVRRWMNGETGGEDDEKYLKLARSVLVPGEVRDDDVTRFASRLYLYPATFDVPFCGKYVSCSFREAIALAAEDPLVRVAAYRKITDVIAYGGGRGEAMAEAAEAYAGFLRDLAKYKSGAEALASMLDAADEKLKGVLK